MLSETTYNSVPLSQKRVSLQWRRYRKEQSCQELQGGFSTRKEYCGILVEKKYDCVTRTIDWQRNPNLRWSRQAGMLQLHPVQVWCCCCTTIRQGKTFPLPLGWAEAAQMSLLGSVLLGVWDRDPAYYQVPDLPFAPHLPTL